MRQPGPARRGGTSPRAQRGLTLLEVLVALIVVGVAAGLFLSSNRTASFGNERSGIYGKAANATLEAVEAVRLMSLDAAGRLRESEIAHTQGGAIRVTATVRSVSASDVHDLAALDTASLRHLTLKTAFQGKGGRQVEKTFTTILYKPQ